MKTTLDLPEPLVREMKLRAVHEGRKLKDVAEEVFWRGLQAPAASREPFRQRLDAPLFVCEAAGVRASEMSVEDLLKLEQQAQVEEDLQRVSRPL
ncbi:MAG: antitoxin [Lentimonas sp.]